MAINVVRTAAQLRAALAERFDIVHSTLEFEPPDADEHDHGVVPKH